MWRNLAAIISFVIATAISGAAVAEEWRMLRAEGKVMVSQDGRGWSLAGLGTEIPNASWIWTGPKGRAILSRGDERIYYGPNALAAISVSVPKDHKTRIIQKRGRLILDIDTRKRRETTVITPHVAAVVKGTVFEVDAGAGSSRVEVAEGVVEVSTASGQVSVAAGQVATSSGAVITVAEVAGTALEQELTSAMSGSDEEAGAEGGGDSDDGGRGKGGGIGGGGGYGSGGGADKNKKK